MARFKAKIVEVLSQGSHGIEWNLHFVRDPYKWEISIVGKLMDDLYLVYVDSESKDTRVWAPTADGIFSSKFFFSILTRDRSMFSCSSLSNIWTSVAPPTIKAFAWISAFRRQNTMEVLQRKMSFLYISPSMCPLCKMDVESENHIFLHCSYTTKVQNFLTQVLSLHFIMPEMVEELFCQWGRGGNVP